tara:strand:+ start:948 stop:1232 length:285 start_codon:yes stop_codon:yes gene_type:complete
MNKDKMLKEMTKMFDHIKAQERIIDGLRSEIKTYEKIIKDNKLNEEKDDLILALSNERLKVKRIGKELDGLRIQFNNQADDFELKIKSMRENLI